MEAVDTDCLLLDTDDVAGLFQLTIPKYMRNTIDRVTSLRRTLGINATVDSLGMLVKEVTLSVSSAIVNLQCWRNKEDGEGCDAMYKYYSTVGLE